MLGPVSSGVATSKRGKSLRVAPARGVAGLKFHALALQRNLVPVQPALVLPAVLLAVSCTHLHEHEGLAC